ncbi:theronine dehydrogenase [Arthrobacter sp. UCD-GKA]|uniref:glucose 1-dehydrogenase n=1 Tax=Arthrobacter sp. UCD-GKA TaxID=1913576 RepID=UPI0008DDD812|nr:glucose 1-dehydrogenase [Arthrobacter sp. UCD-GKA]OIH83527.1 theronine dehydrogenase [Arthrobacter sp. UCD-GKA]
MQALTLIPGVKDSLALRKIPEPGPDQGSVLVEALAVGLCGTDAEITAGNYGQPPPGHKQLVLGHENLGRVLEAPPGSGVAPGDLVVGIVRRPDPHPCPACAAGEWDMCLNGKYTEHGIKQLDGFARGRWRGEPKDMVKLGPGLAVVGVLLELTTIVAKAWEQIMRIGARAFFDPHVAVVTGAGPVGLLAALLGVRRGLEVHVFDIVSDGPKPGLVRGLGATYHSGTLPESGISAEILVECTGITDVVLDVLGRRAPDAITCLTGVSGTGKETEVEVGALNRQAVLGNGVTFGSVNANRRHLDAAACALAAADPAWRGRLFSRRVQLENFADAFKRHPDDVKVVLEIGSGRAAGKDRAAGRQDR